MAWQCRLIERDADGNLPGKYKARKPGDMWYEPGVRDSKRGLSDWYLQHNSHREPLMVCLPSNDGQHDFWMVDAKSDNGEGWQVSGEAPNITTAPSIKTEQYHGFLRDGILTDDIEGRTYNEPT